MPENDNAHTCRMNDSLHKYAGPETAEAIIEKLSILSSADHNTRFDWASRVCSELENALDEDTIKKIRMDCACGPDDIRINHMKKLYDSAADLDDFIAKTNVMDHGFKLYRENGHLLMVYPTCYCPVVRRVNKPLSKTWCYGTLGYAKKLFEGILSCPVTVELLGSIKTGSKDCRVKIAL